MFRSPNPDGKSNRDVIRPWVNALDITRRPRGMWIVDFGENASMEDAALYEAPFEYLKEHVQPTRANLRRKAYRERWWLHAEPCSGMRKALIGLNRYIATPCVAKHRLFVWVSSETLPDHALVVFARDDDYTFGVLHSHAHELWALRMGSRLESRPRYTPTTTFETFPFPIPTAEQKEAIANAAKRLNEQRSGWLNPLDDAVGPKELRRRTLTNLYNRKPTWLIMAHKKLDEAVFRAYGWEIEIPESEILSRLLVLNATLRQVGSGL